jgi:hypothetical protein
MLELNLNINKINVLPAFLININNNTLNNMKLSFE